MAMSNYLEDLVLNGILRGQNFPTAENVYAGLFLTDPGEDGTTGTEVTGNGYARQATTFAAPVQTDGMATCTNDAEIDFGIATGTWGNITHVALFDASTGGNMLYHMALASPKLIEDGDNLRFFVGNLSVSQG